MCMCVRVCICVRVRVCICLCVFISTFIFNSCMHNFVTHTACQGKYTYIGTYTYTYIYTYTYTYIYIYMYIYVYTYVHIHTHINIYIYVYRQIAFFHPGFHLLAVLDGVRKFSPAALEFAPAHVHLDVCLDLSRVNA